MYSIVALSLRAENSRGELGVGHDDRRLDQAGVLLEQHVLAQLLLEALGDDAVASGASFRTSRGR